MSSNFVSQSRYDKAKEDFDNEKVGQQEIKFDDNDSPYKLEDEITGEVESYATKAEYMAEVIRRQKIKYGDTPFVTLPFLPQIWNAAVEIVATSVEAGGKLADAINAGIKYIKESDWYKGLSKEEQKQAIDEFNKAHDAIRDIDIKTKPETFKPKKATEEAAGVKKPSEGIS